MMEEIENAINAFKEDQRQMYAYARFSYSEKDFYKTHWKLCIILVNCSYYLLFW